MPFREWIHSGGSNLEMENGEEERREERDRQRRMIQICAADMFPAPLYDVWG